MTPQEQALAGADWPTAADTYRQRFVLAMDCGDEDAAEEALASALIAERMCEMCEMVTVA